jgi:cation transport regulator ChaB
MASLIYNSAIDDMARGAIDFDTDTFKALLVSSAYTPNKDTHDKRDDVTNEATGTGYTAGGVTTACTVTKDTANDRVTLQFAAVSWATSTITARALVIYKSLGGASSADALVAYNDFGSDVSSTSGTFSVAASTITLQN